ncbi:MAG: type II toxin-antitoxin system VapC family toxin [bacterium]
MKRVYVDTSVFGGVFDDEFQRASQDFFNQIKENQFALIISAVVQQEIEPAPQEVKDFFDSMLLHAEIIEISAGALRLRKAYLDAGIVTVKYSNDALHVALATVSDCTVIVSWNFKHIVHADKFRYIMR